MLQQKSLELEQFPSLKDLDGRVDPDLLQGVLLDFQRIQVLTQEIDAERRNYKQKFERARLDRDVLQTALIGLLNLGGEEDLEAFLQQSLELTARLAGAEVGALALTVQTPLEPRPLLVTRHCTDADLAYIREELEHPRGVLRLAREKNQPLVLPLEADSARLRDNLRQRHVKSAIALPFSLSGAETAHGVLYLEHLSRADAFSSDLRLVHECLRFVSSWTARAERLETRGRLTDHTVPHRRDGRYQQLAGRSQAFSQLLAQLELFRTSRSEAPVLITGEAGTGKASLAATLHQVSPRTAAPYLEVSCDEISDEALELKLFGNDQEVSYGSTHEHGRGVLERARGGTIFLKDVDRLSPALQSRLLRALQERRFVRKHGQIMVRLDVRVLSSSRNGLQTEVRTGRFHPELAERLSLFEILIPPLRERREDILPLAEHFLRQVAGQSSRHGLSFTAAALHELERRVWAGNLHELAECVRAAASACTGQLIDIAHLRDISAPPANDLARTAVKSWKIEHDEFQRRLIRVAMELSNRNVTQAARRLNISRQYLNNRLRTLGMVELRASSESNQDEFDEAGDDDDLANAGDDL